MEDSPKYLGFCYGTSYGSFMTNLRLFGSFDLEEWSIFLNTLVFGMALAMVLI